MDWLHKVVVYDYDLDNKLDTIYWSINPLRLFILRLSVTFWEGNTTVVLNFGLGYADLKELSNTIHFLWRKQ
jgi:hypothetical protein